MSHHAWGTEKLDFQGQCCVGIDLGTTNSCVGLWIVGENRVKIIRVTDTQKTLASVIQFGADTEYIGARRSEDPENTITCIKRLMGKSMLDATVAQSQAYVTYAIVPTNTETAGVQVNRRGNSCVVSAEECSAMILHELKRVAEAYVNATISNAVITVPAYFNDAQRKATIKAAEIAGFCKIRLLNEPSAAAMSYGLFVAGTKKVLVFDLGGGTFDVSILAIEDGVFDVCGIGGDSYLGGEDFNKVIYEYVLRVLYRQYRLKASSFTSLMRMKIQQETERVKIDLSISDKATIRLNDLPNGRQFGHELTRSKFESLCGPLIDRCLTTTVQVLEEAGLQVEDIDEIVLVGGSTRIPLLRSKLSKLFHDKELCTSVSADLAVAEGAAIQAAILSGIDPAIFRDVLMMDMLPLSIGLEKANGEMETILPKNSKIPCVATKYFETYQDDQPGITVEVYEGEEQIAKHNQHIGYFNFPLPRAKRGKAGEFQHPVTFKMNESGVLQVLGGIYNEEEETNASNNALWILGLYCIALFGCYVWFRIYFAEHKLLMDDTIDATIN